MKRILLLSLFTVALIGCSKNKNTMVVSGNVQGLKKGWLYLQKMEDSTLTSIDSLEIRGNGNFSFKSDIEHAELFYLYLNKADHNDLNDRISFFGEKGQIYINTTWDQFEAKAKISGSKSHKEFAEYRAMISNFHRRDLSLAQAAIQENDAAKADSLKLVVDNNYVRRYRYMLNFALTHPNSHVTPYIAITDGLDVNPVYLDSIYKVLPDSIASGKYGKVLAERLKK